MSQCRILAEEDPVKFFFHVTTCATCSSKFTVSSAKEEAMKVDKISVRQAEIILDAEMAIERQCYKVKSEDCNTIELHPGRSKRMLKMAQISTKVKHNRTMLRLRREKQFHLYDLELKEYEEEAGKVHIDEPDASEAVAFRMEEMQLN